MKTKTVLSCLTERGPPRVFSALSIQIAPCKGIQDSLGFWIPVFVSLWNLDSGFQSLYVGS